MLPENNEVHKKPDLFQISRSQIPMAVSLFYKTK